MTVAELVAKLGIDIDRQSWDKAEKGFDKLKSAAEGVVEALAIHKIKEGIDRMIEGTVESAHNVELLSQQLGISTDKVQEMAYAVKSIGEGGLAMSLRQLANHAQNAARKGGEAGIVFSRLGVNLHGANGQLLPAELQALSLGNQQRVQLAAALVFGPDVLVLAASAVRPLPHGGADGGERRAGLAGGPRSGANARIYRRPDLARGPDVLQRGGLPRRAGAVHGCLPWVTLAGGYSMLRPCRAAAIGGGIRCRLV